MWTVRVVLHNNCVRVDQDQRLAWVDSCRSRASKQYGICTCVSCVGRKTSLDLRDGGAYCFERSGASNQAAVWLDAVLKSDQSECNS